MWAGTRSRVQWRGGQEEGPIDRGIGLRVRLSGSVPFRFPLQPTHICTATCIAQLSKDSPHVCRYTWYHACPRVHKPVLNCANFVDKRNLLLLTHDEVVAGAPLSNETEPDLPFLAYSDLYMSIDQPRAVSPVS